jgi:2-dehydro-3-deoxy-D-gluconate 5-dehydrogenase
MILDVFRIDGKVALVTGGTKGIGGADVAVVSRQRDPELEKNILDMGRRYFHYPADLTRRVETKKVVPAIIEKMGDLNILVNNAGICPRAPALDYSETDWDDTLEINLTANFILSQAAARLMIRKKQDKIITVASILAFQGGINIPAYTASKHGLAGLTKALSNAWAAEGINVNAVAPGYFATDFTKALQEDKERFDFMKKRITAGRWGVPKDIAGAVVFLASSASDFIHGTVLPVDGGWLAW